MNTRNSRKSARDRRLAKVVQLLLMPFIAAVAWGIESGQPKYPAGPHPVQTKPQALEIAGGPTNSTEPGSAPAKPAKQKPGVESYPATRFGAAAQGSLSDYLDSIRPLPADHSVVWRRYFESELHPHLDSALPGVRFFLVHQQDWIIDGGPRYYPMALKDGKLYGLERLNQLLLDAGFPFDSASAPTAARIAVLFTLLGDQFTHRFSPGPSSYSEARKFMLQKPDSSQAFPAVEFSKVEVSYTSRTSTVQEPGKEPRKVEYKVPGVWVECTVDGKEVKVRVQFIKVGVERAWEVELFGFPGGGIIYFDWFILPPRVEKGGQGSLPTFGNWTLAVTGDTWTETDGSATHYFGGNCRVGLVANPFWGVHHEAPHRTGLADFPHPALQDNLLTLRRVSHGVEFR